MITEPKPRTRRSPNTSRSNGSKSYKYLPYATSRQVQYITECALAVQYLMDEDLDRSGCGQGIIVCQAGIGCRQDDVGQTIGGSISIWCCRFSNIEPAVVRKPNCSKRYVLAGFNKLASLQHESIWEYIRSKDRTSEGEEGSVDRVAF